MQKIIGDILNMEELFSYGFKEPKFTIKKATLVGEERSLIIPIDLNFIMPFNDYRRVAALLINKLSEINSVSIDFNYHDIDIDDKTLLKLFLPYMAESLPKQWVGLEKSIHMEDVEITENVVTIYTLGKTTCEILNDVAKKKFQEMLKEKFHRNFAIKFQNDKERYISKQEKFRESEEQDIKKYVEELKENPKPKFEETPKPETKKQDSKKKEEWSKIRSKRKEKELPANGNKIMGTGIQGKKNVEIKDLDPKQGKVIIEGVIFKKDSRVIRSGSTLVSLLVTDNTTTVCCKAFLSEEKWFDIDNNLSYGDGVRILGEVQFDTFENMNSIMMDAIDKMDTDSQGRHDNCTVGKRVELHIHSKMSAMDGLNEASEIVSQAAAWGHPAVAITDHGVVQAFPDAQKEAEKQTSKGRPIKLIFGLEGYVFDDSDGILENGKIDYKAKGTNHIIILAKSQLGLKNIYKLVSYSHINYFYKKPRIPWSVLSKHREGLIIGSACEAGEIYQGFIKYTWDNKSGHHVKEALPYEKIKEIARKYDYLEIQPVMNNRFMLERDYYFNGKPVKTEDDLREINKAIVKLADELNIPVIATSDAHYKEPEDALYRNILMAGQGYKDAENGQGLYMKTTEEMLKEFSYLGEEKAIQVVITNSNKVAESVEEGILPVPKDKCPPILKNDKEILRNSCMEKAYSIYGNPLPKEIAERLEKELSSIIDNGYAVMYVSAQMLVNKSLSDGYLVGSRGSVGSSFAATMAGITEVNPLEPHYICPDCKHIEWGDMNEYDCGIDMPPKNCPKCKAPMKRDGFTIPFATFLGFDGDKEPDIDLNFAGEYQPIAHKYVGEIFGEKNVFKAGTVGSVAEKTAYGYVKKYFEERMMPINKYDVDRLAYHCTGVKKTTGQHPGGIIIVPDNREIYEFCPIQRPANDTTSDIITTHFDYHKIDQNLLKLDILGHDVPQMIRQLQDMTGVDPLGIDLTDRKVLSIFNGIEALNIQNPDYMFTHGTFAIPEFGTAFTRQMLDDIHPDKFADLVRISGFSHGTDVWLNNAQDYIRSGTATMREVISTRDDIMNYLILKGIENKTSFKIMEAVRKNKPLSDEQLEIMKSHGVPEWYVDSCIKIKYMFPRAHAVAYVMMSFRMAWFKVYYPVEFYATYFTSKAANFNSEVILQGIQAILDKMTEIDLKGTNATAKEKDEYIVLEVAYEMYSRGFEFLNAKLGESHASKFRVKDGKVLLPFVAIEGVGDTAAVCLYEEFKLKPFDTIEEASIRAKLNKTAVLGMKNHGIFSGLPETDQLCMF